MLKQTMIKIAMVALLPLSLFSFEVDFNKKFHKELMADTLSTEIMIRIDSSSEKEISKKLTKFNEEIQDSDEVEKKLGNYTIRPSYKYSSTHTPKIIGYIGELRYTINSTKAKNINEFITSLNELKKSRNTSITVSNLSWKVKDETYNIALDILRLQAINWAEVYSQNLSSDIKKRCIVKNITINTHRNINPMARFALEGVSATQKSVPVPSSNRQKIVINPSYKLECK